MVLRACLTLLLASTACSSSPYLEDWGQEEVLGGKADGLADLADPIELGETVLGTLDEHNLRLFKLDLQRGDELDVVENITSGDLQPHFTLYFGVSEALSSSDFEVTATRLTKVYEIESTGTHIFAVRAYQNQGSGSFDFGVECTAGPCNGDYPDELLSVQAADDCIERARVCSFEDMQVYSGAVGPARSRSLFEGCLNKLGTEDGASCRTACVNTDPDSPYTADPNEVCDAVITSLPFFADQDHGCYNVLDFCLGMCGDLSFPGYPENDISDLPFSRCWSFGYNSTCPSYAEDHEACSGTMEADSEDECEALCHATDGAWADDLSSACPSDICS